MFQPNELKQVLQNLFDVACLDELPLAVHWQFHEQIISEGVRLVHQHAFEHIADNPDQIFERLSSRANAVILGKSELAHKFHVAS